MSADELKRKTVCLKLAKNGIFLCKNPSNVKFVSPREVPFGLKQLKEYNDQPKIEPERIIETSSKKSEKIKKEPEGETVLQKFIRGFDCGEYCDDSFSSGYSSGLGEFSGSHFNGSDSIANSSQERKPSVTEFSTTGSRPQCRVEFVTPVKMGEIPSRESVKSAKPLIVDLSQKKIVLKDNPIKIVKSTPNELRQLNRNFITPKVKVENFSQSSESSSLPLIISPAETPNFSGSSSRSPYPSTKIEIDYTGSSIQDERYIDPDFPRPIKSEITEYAQSQKMIYGQDSEFCLQDSEGFDDAYRNFNNMIQQQSYWNSIGHNQPYNMAPQQSSHMNRQPANLNIQQSYATNINQMQPYSLGQNQQYNNMAQHYSLKNTSHKQAYNINHPNQSQVEGWAGDNEADVLKAAKALYSKRTRTLFHWINPNMPKSRLKDSVSSAWYNLPSWQKQIYINQVIGKCGSDSVSPMVNPQILEINGMAEVVMSSMNRAEEEAIQPPRKKRKYTRKSTTVGSSSRANAPSLPSLSPGSSLYNFLSSL